MKKDKKIESKNKKIVIVLAIVIVSLGVYVIHQFLISRKYEIISTYRDINGYYSNTEQKGYTVREIPDGSIVTIVTGSKPDTCYSMKVQSISINRKNDVHIKVKDKKSGGICGATLVTPEVKIKFKFKIRKIKVEYTTSKEFLNEF